MNLWVIAFPCLIYLGSFGVQLSFHKSTATFWANIVGAAMGIVFVYQQNTQLTSNYWSALPYFSISLSHDRHPDHPACQGHSRCHGGVWNWWIVQGHRHHVHRVLCPLCYELFASYCAVGEARCYYLLIDPL